MSGGVDSSVAAYILKEQGYDLTGVTLRLCEEYTDNDDVFGEGPVSDPNAKEGPTGLDMASAIAGKLDIDFMVMDYRNEFQEFVIDPFVNAYENGTTPNPCVECNRCLKFGKLIDDSDEGFEGDMENAPMLATGHYAVIEEGSALYGDENSHRWRLAKASDPAKDQSYFLYSLDQETLSRSLFPLGNLDKDEVRKIAEKQGFVNAHRKDSQDICFIQNGDYTGFIEAYTGKDYRDGYFVDTEGNTLGIHKGIIRYTVGQRKGLGLSLKKPMYVYKIDAERNEVVLADDEQLFSRELHAEDFNWVSMAEPDKPFRALGRIRYRHKEAPCTVSVNEDGSVHILFDEAQRAITAGQSVVLYDIESDRYVLGGGIISK